MADLFSTNILLGVQNSLIATPQFFLDKFFPSIQAQATEEIHFDVLNKTRRLAPFVSPVVAGKPMLQNGMTTKTFKPAYVKPKFVFNPRRALKRSAGEPIGGSLNPAQRVQVLLAQDLQDQMDMINRRMEVMAAEALRTGAVTVTGELYPTQNVSFGRDAGLTVTLSGAARWGQSGVKPLDSLQDWSQTMLQKSGAMPTEVVMDVATWKVFRADADVKTRLDRFRGITTMQVDAQIAEGGVFMGNIDGFNIYVYAGWYLDDTDTEQPILPSGTVIMAGSGNQVEGIRAFGAIEDFDANLQALPYFPKSWQESDPSLRYLMTQSAPLVVPTRINATFAASVL